MPEGVSHHSRATMLLSLDGLLGAESWADMACWEWAGRKDRGGDGSCVGYGRSFSAS